MYLRAKYLATVPRLQRTDPDRSKPQPEKPKRYAVVKTQSASGLNMFLADDRKKQAGELVAVNAFLWPPLSPTVPLSPTGDTLFLDCDSTEPGAQGAKTFSRDAHVRYAALSKEEKAVFEVR